MAIDLKFGRVTVERARNRAIGEDEPVFVLRAQDRLAVAVIAKYYILCEDAGSPPEHLDGIREALNVFDEWQATHPTQTPGSNELPRGEE